MRALLRAEAARHARMEAQDVYKLLYQRCFGPGHMVADTASAVAWVEEEAACVKKPRPLYDPIGNGLVRLYLDSEAFLPAYTEAAGICFAGTANSFAVQPGNFPGMLEEAVELSREECFPWTAEALSAYIGEQQSRGFPAVHHSETYRAAYDPRYRVMEERFARALPAAAVLLAAAKKPRAVLAVDGRCGCGKTTLAETLAAIFGWPVVHMDDFFLPFDLRTAARLSQPGGNVHYERVEEEVLQPFTAGKPVTYRPFCCEDGSFSSPVTLPESRFLLLEGSYAHHPRLRRYITDFVFVTASRETQLARLAARNPRLLPAFRERWIPLEEAYFEACPPPEGCVTLYTDI